MFSNGVRKTQCVCCVNAMRATKKMGARGRRWKHALFGANGRRRPRGRRHHERAPPDLREPAQHLVRHGVVARGGRSLFGLHDLPICPDGIDRRNGRTRAEISQIDHRTRSDNLLLVRIGSTHVTMPSSSRMTTSALAIFAATAAGFASFTPTQSQRSGELPFPPAAPVDRI